MKRLLIAAALALAACTPTTGTNPVTPVADAVVLNGTKAFLVAEYAYNAAATAALAATNAGLITGQKATDLRALNAKATQALIMGKSAQGAAAKAAQASVIFDAVADIRALLTR